MKLIRLINYTSVFLTIILTLLSVFKYHTEMHCFFKICIIFSCLVLGVYTLYYIPRKVKYGIRDYFFSLLFQSFIFVASVFGAKDGAYKELA